MQQQQRQREQAAAMGNHVKARPRAKPKPKSVKAKVNRKMGSKRRLSRMGKDIKKGQKGAAASYLTRAQVGRPWLDVHGWRVCGKFVGANTWMVLQFAAAASPVFLASLSRELCERAAPPEHAAPADVYCRRSGVLQTRTRKASEIFKTQLAASMTTTDKNAAELPRRGSAFLPLSSLTFGPAALQTRHLQLFVEVPIDMPGPSKLWLSKRSQVGLEKVGQYL